MPKIKRFLALALLAVLMLALTGCGDISMKMDYSKGDSAAFTRMVAYAVTTRTDAPELFDAGTAHYFSMGEEPLLQPYFAMLDYKAKADPDDPSLVHYSCRIPGAVCVCLNMAYGTCFKKGPDHSKWVNVEGDVRVVTDGDGNRRIDISQLDNAFAAYAALRYVNPLYFTANGLGIRQCVAEDRYADTMNTMLNRCSEAYGALTGVPSTEYADSVIVPELMGLQDSMQKIVSSAGGNGYGFWNTVNGYPTSVRNLVIGGGALLGLYLLYLLIKGLVFGIKWLAGRIFDRWAERSAGSADDSDGDGTLKIAAGDIDELNRQSAYESMQQVRTAVRFAVDMAEFPQDSQVNLSILCKNLHMGLRYDSFPVPKGVDAEAYRHDLLTAAGWSAAAIGRILAQKMPLTGNAISANMERLSIAIDHSNEVVGKLNRKIEARRKQIEELNNMPDGADVLKQSAAQLAIATGEEEIQKLQEEYNRGLGNYMLDNGDLPLAYLVFILRDSQNRFPRFIKQGVIMGLVDWLVKDRDNAEAADLLKTVIAVRASMIQSDNELTFFEVRVPKGCGRTEYASILKDVLHCANPSVQYGDTNALLANAEKEIKGVMDMLYACPLRLIDPANRRTMGFYQFKPYIHAMWVQYTPPERTGKVISRYHEVDDRTKPLSSGLNLKLFCDSYAVIPTLFHEYQHFMGDGNEASVFLKTQLFSIRFYKKYRAANAKEDGVFATMTTTLGIPPAVDKLPGLNALIERAYGKQLSPADAAQRADREIANINAFVKMANDGETWDPDVKMPMLSEKEDAKNMSLIRGIVIRFATVPKSINKDEFIAILKGRAKTIQEMAGMRLSGTMMKIGQKVGVGAGATAWMKEILTECRDIEASRILDRKAQSPNDLLFDSSSFVKSKMEELGLEESDVAELDEVVEHLRLCRLYASDCELNLRRKMGDKAPDDIRSTAKALQAAAKRARKYNQEVITVNDFATALMKKPTATMRRAGIVDARR